MVSVEAKSSKRMAMSVSEPLATNVGDPGPTSRSSIQICLLSMPPFEPALKQKVATLVLVLPAPAKDHFT